MLLLRWLFANAPVGGRVFDLPPAYDNYPNQLRTLTSGPAPVQTIPFVKTDWPNPQPIGWYQDWKQSPNIPVPSVPPGATTNQLTSGFDYPIQLRTLINSPAPVFVSTQLPFSQFNWPLARDYDRVTPSWTYQYLLNLIGMDQFPVGGADGQNQQLGIPIPPPYVDYYTWLHSPLVPPTVIQQLPPGQTTNVIIPGPDYSVQLRTLINSPAPVIAVTTLPFNQTDWPNPVSTTWYRDWYKSPQVPPVVIVQLPPGQTSNVLGSGPDYPIQLRTLINAPAPVFVSVQNPFRQTDWPLPQGYPLPIKSWEWWYNLNLIGMDQFPVGGNTTGGQNDSHGIPIPPPYVDYYTWLHSPQIPPVVVVPLPPGARILELPGQPTYPYQIASISAGPAPVFVPAPPATDLHFKPHLITIGRMGNLGGLS